MFTGWVYDYLSPHAKEIKVAHPAILKAIAASKKKNDHVDARKIAPQWNAALAQVHARELKRGNPADGGTLAVARKMVAYLMSVDKHQKDYEIQLPAEE